jgi:predicted signal transduction protein with EAL and GGDEF domain
MQDEEEDGCMQEAFRMAQEALDAQEVPIGCVIALSSTHAILATGRNRTNQYMNVHSCIIYLVFIVCRRHGMQSWKQSIHSFPFPPIPPSLPSLYTSRLNRV